MLLKHLISRNHRKPKSFFLTKRRKTAYGRSGRLAKSIAISTTTPLFSNNSHMQEEQDAINPKKGIIKRKRSPKIPHI